MVDAALARVVPLRTAPGPRPIVTLHPAIAARYERLVAAVAPAIEAHLPNGVVANRVAAIGVDSPGIDLRPWRLERRRYTMLVRTLARRADALLVSDVRRCYASIRPEAVADALRSVDAVETDVRALVALLRRLERFGVPGLPVGPTPSAVLANGVLLATDRELARLGFAFVRWVDDVVVALASATDADRALAAIDAGLAGAGLERHRGKTRIVDGREAIGGIELSAARRRAEVPEPLG